MIKEKVKRLRDLVERRVRTEVRKAKEASSALVAMPAQRTEMQTEEDDPPVVARLIVEIRSDGTRTVARGALQDELSGERVSVQARGTTPLELAGQLAKSLMTLPLTAGDFVRARKQAEAEGRQALESSASGNDDEKPTS